MHGCQLPQRTLLSSNPWCSAPIMSTKEMSDKDVSIITLISKDNQVFQLPVSELTRECGYIQGLMRSGMRECDERLNSVISVHLSAVSGITLEIAVNFLRGQQVAVFVMNIIQDVLMTATYLQIPDLIEHCGQFLLQNMDPDNILDIIDTSEQFSLLDVQVKSREYLHSIVPTFSDTCAFLEMDSSDVISLLATDDLEVKEMDVFKAAIKWFKHYEAGRVTYMTEVLTVVRFLLMTAKELKEAADVLSTTGLLDDHFEGQIKEATLITEQFHLIHHQTLLNSTNLRRTMKSVLLLGGFTAKEHSTCRFQLLPVHELTSSDSNHLQFCSSKTDKLPTTLCEHSACVLDNFLYVAGGQTVLM